MGKNPVIINKNSARPLLWVNMAVMLYHNGAQYMAPKI